MSLHELPQLLPQHITGSLTCTLRRSITNLRFNKLFPQEVHSEEIDADSAYILFYEQQGVDYSQFLPKIDGKKLADTSSMDEDFESDYRKYCVLQ